MSDSFSIYTSHLNFEVPGTVSSHNCFRKNAHLTGTMPIQLCTEISDFVSVFCIKSAVNLLSFNSVILWSQSVLHTSNEM